jgi:hypothetical protein
MQSLAVDLLGPPTSRSSTEWRWRGKGSLGVHVAGLKRGRFFDNEETKYGDALDLIEHVRRCSLPDANRWAMAWLGEPDLPPAPVRSAKSLAAARERPRQPSKTAPLAQEFWQGSGPAAGTLVERYLVASRGLELPADAPIRFHPWCWRNPEHGPRGPAMLAVMTDPASGARVGTHVTYLRPDGAGKAEGHAPRIKLGNAGVVRLVPDSDVALGLGIAEGIETSLAVMQHFGWSPVWAAGDAGSIESFPLLAGIEALTVFADADENGRGMNAARACVARWAQAGREARIAAPPGLGDFADLARRAA